MGLYPLPWLKSTLNTCETDVLQSDNLMVQRFSTSLGLLSDGTKIEIRHLLLGKKFLTLKFRIIQSVEF